VVVRDIEPPGLPICVGVDKLVRQILLRGVLPQLDVGSSDYSGVGGTWLRLDAEELPEKHPMRLDTEEGFAEVDEDRGVEDAVGVLSGILPRYSCEEGRIVEDGLLVEFPCTPTRTRSVYSY
jgi:hypothetical protein